VIVPPIKWLKPPEIRARAEVVLDRFHPSHDLPVPVEELVDVHLELDIIPLVGLKAGFDFDAFLSNDLTSIYVDEYVYEQRESRYRFTLAHELGHVELHDYIYQSCEIGSVDDFRRFNDALGPKHKADMEWQANHFAGYLLAPDAQVLALWNDLWPELREKAAEAERHGFEPHQYRDVLLEAAAARMCEEFSVSPECMKLRLLTAVRDGVFVLPP
jgi:Zn-dependent peptidase ImmA (M78 family)